MNYAAPQAGKVVKTLYSVIPHLI